MDHKQFISNSKSLLIAPAGHGKTHLITDCLKYTEGKQLILTHTHAGVASIVEKIKKAKLPSSKFHVETITGYAQKYVQAYYTGTDIPDRDKDSNAYYTFLIEKAMKIIGLPIIAKTIKLTYAGLFVDEYQDCTLQQHALVSLLSVILPTRILGDPLQGIFSFNSSMSMVDINNAKHMGDFNENKYELQEPWRWKEINEPLGKALKGIRLKIEAKEPIDLNSFPEIEFIQVADVNDAYNPQKKYYQDINKILKEKNVLLIHPTTSSIYPRKKLIGNYKVPITLVEAIDDKDFYDLARLFDNDANNSIEKIVYKACIILFNKTEVGKWVSENGAINRTKEWKASAQALSSMFAQSMEKDSHGKCAKLLRYISKLDKVRCFRKELLSSLCAALEEATVNKKSVYESMIDKRNHVRKVGRKVYGRCIGTTLLTKGLEFETVIILNAHEFDCPKNLYVALTRASKRLVVFSNSHTLSPYKSDVIN